MIHEDFAGNVRHVTWGELQDLSNRFANVLRSRGVERGDRVAMLLPPTPEAAAAFFGTWKVGAILLSMSVLYGDEGIRHRLTDSEAKVLVTNAANAVSPADLDNRRSTLQKTVDYGKAEGMGLTICEHRAIVSSRCAVR